MNADLDAIANYFGKLSQTDFPLTYNVQYKKQQDLRYGENPHQKAAFYRELNPPPAALAMSQQQQGKPLSFNNMVDADAALACVKSFNDPACVIVKHATPCGVAVATPLSDAYQRAFATDPSAAFGGIIAFNRTVDKVTARTIITGQFVEVLIAPDFDADALGILKQKANIRVLSCGNEAQTDTCAASHYDLRTVSGGLLLQERDDTLLHASSLRVVTRRQPTPEELNDLLFAWKTVAFVKSNAIVFAKNTTTIGIGAGQTSRIMSVKLATIKASEAHQSAQGAVMASDAFFPFRDGIDAAAQQGIAAIIQPGGSLRDEEVILAANETNIAMVFTGIRHFRH